MKPWKIIIVLIKILFVISLYCCVPEEVILHGNISGYVTHAETSEPLHAVSIKLNPSNVTTDTTSTGSNGSYLLKNLTPGNYEIEASKPAYEKITQNAAVESANTTEINFSLNPTSSLEVSDTLLDYGVDLTQMYFTISNSGSGKLDYTLTSTQEWITVSPRLGDATTETDTIKVTIDRAGLFDNKHEAVIIINSYLGEVSQEDKVYVFVNGVFDQHGYYYGLITIGTQTWMAENLNRGIKINLNFFDEPRNNETVEKFCYDDDEKNCNIYGGLYSWDEMMDYYPEDTGTIGTTQGLCPAGYHIPTKKEWVTLAEYLGGTGTEIGGGYSTQFDGIGGVLKDTGTIENGTGLWLAPNIGATNETGFTALPGGWSYWDWEDQENYKGFFAIGGGGEFWHASKDRVDVVSATDNFNVCHGLYYSEKTGSAVRCIKDPE